MEILQRNLRWQALVALIGAILLASILGHALWQKYRANWGAIYDPDHHPRSDARRHQF